MHSCSCMKIKNNLSLEAFIKRWGRAHVCSPLWGWGRCSRESGASHRRSRTPGGAWEGGEGIRRMISWEISEGGPWENKIEGEKGLKTRNCANFRQSGELLLLKNARFKTLDHFLKNQIFEKCAEIEKRFQFPEFDRNNLFSWILSLLNSAGRGGKNLNNSQNSRSLGLAFQMICKPLEGDLYLRLPFFSKKTDGLSTWKKLVGSTLHLCKFEDRFIFRRALTEQWPRQR